MGWSVIRHDLMAWRTLTVLPLAVAVVLFALAGAGSHLQSLNPAASLHELIYGAPAGPICTLRYIDPSEPRIAREIRPEARFLEVTVLGEAGDPFWELRGLPERQHESRFDLRVRR